MRWRRSAVMSPRRSSCWRALFTASRDAPTQPASSRCEIGRSIRITSAGGVAVAFGELDQPVGDAPHDVERGELRPLAVGVAQPADDRAQQDQREVRLLRQGGEEPWAGDDERLPILDDGDGREVLLAVDRGELA